MMTRDHPRGRPMKSAIALFVLAVLGTASAGVGIAAWTGHLGHRESSMRAIHYDTSYDLSARRRMLIE
jgi:hypothetical protein